MDWHEFAAELWAWQAREDSWVFLSVPPPVSEEIADQVVAEPRGFGSVRVEVELGTSTWRTSVFPTREQGGYVLPVKRAVRTREGVGTGDEVRLRLRVLDGA